MTDTRGKIITTLQDCIARLQRERIESDRRAEVMQHERDEYYAELDSERTAHEATQAELQKAEIRAAANESGWRKLDWVRVELEALVMHVRTDYITIVNTDDDSMIDHLDPEEIEDELVRIYGLLDTPVHEPPALTEARELLQCLDDDTDSVMSHELRRRLQAWLAAHPEPKEKT